MRSACHSPLACLVSCLLVAGFTRSGFAQEAPSDLPALAAPPDSPTGPPQPEEAPRSAPSSDEPVADSQPEPAPLASAPLPASTGNAAFAPLSEAPRARQAPLPRAAAPSSTSPASAEPAPLSAPGAEPAAVHHQEEPENADDSAGLFGPFRIGVLAGGGLPEILSLGGQIKVTRFFGAGINIGLIPTVKISFYGDAKLSYQEYDAYGRVYPFGGAFFVGAGVGYASIKGTVNGDISTSDLPAQYRGFGIPDPLLVDSQGSVRTLVLTPQVGFMKIFGSGFTIGFDVGAQLPIAPSKVDFATNIPNLPDIAKSYVQATYVKPNDDKVRSTLDTIGRTPLPTFNLKIGWFL